MNYIKSFLICKCLFVLNSVNIANIPAVNGKVLLRGSINKFSILIIILDVTNDDDDNSYSENGKPDNLQGG